VTYFERFVTTLKMNLHSTILEHKTHI